MSACDRCGGGRATVRVYDVPEIEGWHLFGDVVTSRDLCDGCLVETSAEGEWDRVERLEGVR